MPVPIAPHLSYYPSPGHCPASPHPIPFPSWAPHTAQPGPLSADLQPPVVPSRVLTRGAGQLALLGWLLKVLLLRSVYVLSPYSCGQTPVKGRIAHLSRCDPQLPLLWVVSPPTDSMERVGADESPSERGTGCGVGSPPISSWWQTRLGDKGSSALLVLSLAGFSGCAVSPGKK